jgi:hypothetical protein
LEREAGRLDNELASQGEEDWAIAWKKRATSLERIWGELDQRVAEFLKQAAAVRAWLPINDRLASLTALGVKVATSDAALARAVSNLAATLRERFATDHWEPVFAHADIAVRLGALESQAQGLLYTRVQAYSGELDTLRVRFNDFLSGPAPQISVRGARGKGEEPGPSFTALYAWALQGFCASVERFRERRARGLAWRHPTRKSQSWTDIDAQFGRALAAARSASDFPTLLRVGELLLLMRQGFEVAAAERGEAVYEGADGAVTLPNVAHLLAEGRVRVRLEWIGRKKRG